MHFFGENLEDDDDYEFMNESILTPRDALRLQNRLESTFAIDKNEIRTEILKPYIPKLGPFQTFFTLMKGFIGIAMLLFPNGYYNAGWLFATISIVFISILILLSMNLLLTVSDENQGSFSSIGEKCLGRPGKIFWDLAISLTQTGFLWVHIVFISQNFNGILNNNFGVTINKWIIGAMWLAIYAPLTWVRRIQYFAKFHVFADISVMLALIVIVVYGVFTVRSNHSFSNDVQPINTNHFMVFIGTCVFAFEGVGIIIPVKDTCNNPDQYRKILILLMTLVAWLLIGFGTFNYFVYGSENLKDAKLITRLLPHDFILQIVETLFILNLFISYPLVLHPANVIIESYIYHGMSQSLMRKWLKNINRTALVAFTLFMGLYFEETLDRLMSLVGSLCLTPIAFILPAYFHYRLCAKTCLAKLLDLFIIMIGSFLMFFITGFTIITWNQAEV